MTTYGGTKIAHPPRPRNERNLHAYIRPGVAPDLSRGLCVNADPELFHPVGDNPASRAQALLVTTTYCGPCPVRDTCLDWGRERRETGIWGGIWLDRGAS